MSFLREKLILTLPLLNQEISEEEIVFGANKNNKNTLCVRSVEYARLVKIQSNSQSTQRNNLPFWFLNIYLDATSDNSSVSIDSFS